jgi:hypothetical protein
MSTTTKIRLLAGAAVSLGAVTTASASTSADEVRAIVAEMMADAETRSSLLQSGGSAGYDEGFVIRDSAGNFELKVNGHLSFRYFATFLDDENAGDDDIETGFQTGYARLWASGYAFTPNLFYRITGNFDSVGGGVGGEDGDFELQEAYVGYEFSDNIALLWGQFRPHFARAFNIEEQFQLAVDRSFTTEFFRQDFAQGIELWLTYENWRGWVSFSDGLASGNTDFTNEKNIALTYDPITGNITSFGTPFGGEADLAFVGRFEYKFAGTWDQFDDFTSTPGSDLGVLLGAAAAIEWADGDNVNGVGFDTAGNPVDADDLTIIAWTIDVGVEGNGWNLFAAGYGQHVQLDEVTTNNIVPTTSDDIDYDNFGLVVQGGWFIPESDIELFGRYDVIFLDDDLASDDDDTFNTLTFGANWYWMDHNAKFTLDLQWFLDDAGAIAGSGIGGLGANSQIGYLASGEDEVSLRAQFQLFF